MERSTASGHHSLLPHSPNQVSIDCWYQTGHIHLESAAILEIYPIQWTTVQLQQQAKVPVSYVHHCAVHAHVHVCEWITTPVHRMCTCGSFGISADSLQVWSFVKSSWWCVLRSLIYCLAWSCMTGADMLFEMLRQCCSNMCSCRQVGHTIQLGQSVSYQVFSCTTRCIEYHLQLYASSAVVQLIQSLSLCCDQPETLWVWYLVCNLLSIVQEAQECSQHSEQVRCKWPGGCGCVRCLLGTFPFGPLGVMTNCGVTCISDTGSATNPSSTQVFRQVLHDPCWSAQFLSHELLLFRTGILQKSQIQYTCNKDIWNKPVPDASTWREQLLGLLKWGFVLVCMDIDVTSHVRMYSVKDQLLCWGMLVLHQYCTGGYRRKPRWKQCFIPLWGGSTQHGSNLHPCGSILHSYGTKALCATCGAANTSWVCKSHESWLQL